MALNPQLNTQVAVLVVGAGPTGLITACRLRQHGIAVQIIDAATSPATASRASLIHLRTLEVLEKLDLADSIIAQGVRINEMALYERQTHLSGLDFTNLHDRYKHAVALPQTETESTLTQKYHDLGGTIHRDITVLEILQNDPDKSVRLRVRHNPTQTTTELSAKYVVAADGLRSTLRKALDIPFEGSQYGQAFVTADVRLDASIWPHQQNRDKVNLYLDPSGFLLVVPFPSSDDNLWRVTATVDDAPKNPDHAYLDALVRARGPLRAQPNSASKSDDRQIVTAVEWSSHFRISHRLAARYRANRVCLAGDAAHCHSPAGGQGMNTGIQDGDCLAEVLAAALQSGLGAAADLDRYESARRPVAKGVLALTHQLTFGITLSHPWACWARNWLVWATIGVVPGLRRYLSWRVSELER